ncbi:hypothetical protein IPJ72_05860 [Candidatus Peregrinibacteria bacterium]|nr:MAG: hypothetical protein IPJ72_05860 [Candidatus Peregrinibacteria bacterium]
MKNCKNCTSPFEVTESDRAFYDKVSPIIAGKKYRIPEPTLCPNCRQQRRGNFRNERNLYHRKCDLSGKQMISTFHRGTAFPVYHILEWTSDKWDPLDYGRDFDFSRPFFEQFYELSQAVPRYNLFVDPTLDENSEFTNCASESRNCYLIFQAEKNEDCYYARGINRSKNCVDCLRVSECEQCYECIDTNVCFSCTYCQDCDHCSNCHFSTDLRGCRNCFGCHGLRNKEYHLFNQPLSKEEWIRKVSEIMKDPKKRAAAIQKSEQTRLSVPKKAVQMTNCEKGSGDYLINCKNVKGCFESKDLEDCAYCYEIGNGAKDCYDFTAWGINTQLIYEGMGIGYNVFHTLFSVHCWQNVSNVLYSQDCFPSVSNLFGCIGIRRNEYCILNKKYSREDYEALVPKIIDHMKKADEWGEFFPIEISPYGYNETIAQDHFPLTKEAVINNGWKWYEEEPSEQSYRGPQANLTENIYQVDESICKKILTCDVTGKPYKIIPQELNFYKKMGIPIPKKIVATTPHGTDAKRNPRILFDRTCAECQKPIQTTYAPDRPEKVLCENCYLKQVY